MRFCEAPVDCSLPVFRTDKKERKGYCKNHWFQYSTDIDKRSIVEKAISKHSAKKSKNDTESYKNLKKDADDLASMFVRMRDSDENGIAKCYTCPREGRWQELQCGHVISRSESGVRFDYTYNLRIQCEWCNSRHETEPDIFRNKIEQERPGTLEYLDEKAREVTKLSVSDLREIVSDLKFKIKLIKTKFKQC